MAASVDAPQHVTSPKEILQKIALGGASNMAAACVTNPLDLVKVRQQLFVKATADARPLNWGATLVTMVKTEGVLSIYKGLSASLIREASYSGIRMGMYDFSKTIVLRTVPWGDKDSFGVKLGGGLISGMMGAAIANPADLLKVRMQTLGATGSLGHHASSIYQVNGVKGLYRAVIPTTLRAGILTASQLGVYDHAKFTLLYDFPTVFQEGFGTHFVASGIAGFVCATVSSPIDVIKVTMMADKTHQYRSTIHCAAVLMKTGGPRAFFRGWSMSMLRLWPHSVLSILFLETGRKLAGLPPI